jgi:protein TonB
MLENAIFESARRGENRKPVTIVYSVLVHTAAIGILLVIPLLQMQAIPIPRLDKSLPAPQFVHQDVIELDIPRQAPQLQLITDPDAVIAPQFIPERITTIIEAPADAPISFSSPGNTSIASILRESIGKPEEEVAPPVSLEERDPPVATSEAPPIRVGSGVQQASLIRQVKPAYPDLAMKARIQGIVVLEAMINKEGAIETLRVVSGHPLLTQAAMDAVRQWTYKPTLLNSQPVAVVTTITVTFSLQ